jgi:hypothetical protein
VRTRDRRLVLLALAAAVLASFGAGIAYWVVAGRHHQLCSDGLPPVKQQDTGLGQIVYRCHNGQVVTGSILP